MEVREMEDIIKQAGWIPIRRKRRKLEYIYASKRQGRKMVEKYIGSARKVQDMTPAQILGKLQATG